MSKIKCKNLLKFFFLSWLKINFKICRNLPILITNRSSIDWDNCSKVELINNNIAENAFHDKENQYSIPELSDIFPKKLILLN